MGARLPHGFAKRGLELAHRTSVRARRRTRSHQLVLGTLALYYAVCGAAYALGWYKAGVDCGYTQALALAAAVAGIAIRTYLHNAEGSAGAQRHGELVGAASPRGPRALRRRARRDE